MAVGVFYPGNIDGGFYPGNIRGMTGTHTAFVEHRCVARGDLRDVLLQAKALLDAGKYDVILFFEDATGRQVDFDFRGTPQEVVDRALPKSGAGPGRPKLGVVSREISLLPRHWEWLEDQPHGISATLRRLVEEASKSQSTSSRSDTRRIIDAAYRVMSVLAGNRRNFEEASRALFARDQKRFEKLSDSWPNDVKNHLRSLLSDAWATPKPKSKPARSR
jgi:hypothetical protein